MSEPDSAIPPPATAPGPTPPPPVPPRRDGSGSSSLQSLAIVVVIAVFVITFLVQAFQIPSESMEKTLLTGDYLLVDKVRYGPPGVWKWMLPYRPIHRQDIIVFRYPVDPRQHFVKRVIGIPGDRVRLVNKRVYVNGVRQDDSFATFRWWQRDPFRDDFPNGDPDYMGANMAAGWHLEMKKLVDDGELIVPQNSYFVMGDNRDDSDDSRFWGFVPAENVVGRPLLIYWSMDRSPAAPAPQPGSDKLSSLAYSVAHMWDSLRWQRMMRIVH